ncbi:phosphatase PAP2 family protein [Shewanella insulae]|uniref:phosphatase PAP2 family protein n=1 Tax=Shewanella insulae TaxID=2681496 RepID=UPI001EFECA58|nr:phosphatase PAP2 family protein [Shewanella insulae]MCG9739325.1 phosphatase PAP2 family protein [Shewanella insulae]
MLRLEQVQTTGETAPTMTTDRSRYGALLLLVSILALLCLNQDLNQALFSAINNLSPSLPQWLQLGITDLGHGSTLGTIMLICLLPRPELLPRVMSASLLSMLLVPLLKQYFDVLRPAATLDFLYIVGETRLHHSFPSGHSTSAFLFAGTLLMVIQDMKSKAALLAGAALVACSRILVGAHWPVDVLAGALLGLSCAYLASYVPLIRLSIRHWKIVVGILLLTLVVCQYKETSSQMAWQIIGLRWGLLLLASMLVIRQYLQSRQPLAPRKWVRA